MIERKTVVDRIEITRDGYVQIRLGLLLVEDGREIHCEWHRTAVEPGGDVERQIAAVNTNLAAMGKGTVDASGVGRIKSFAKLAHSPEVVADFRSKGG